MSWGWLDNEAWAAWAGAGVAIVALLATLGFNFSHGRTLKRANDHADEALAEARKATAEASRAADAQENIARTQEQMLKSMERQEASAARRSPEGKVAWRMLHHRGSMYMLENAGTAPAYDVLIKAPDVARFDPPAQDPVDEIPPGGAVTFGAVLAMGTGDTVIVEWADAEGSEHRHTWTRPLPPKPKS